jgi:hypothetical protein
MIFDENSEYTSNMGYIQPISILTYNIYDILYNDNNELIIIAPYRPNPNTIKYISHENNILIFDLYKCPHNHTYIYSLRVDYSQRIKISINDVIIETNVNKYPTFKDEIIFSTIVKNEDEFIPGWIDYHIKLGVSRFIIYDNSNDVTLSTVLERYIKNNIVLLIKWTYPYMCKISGISGQTTQQNHSIYAFRNSKYIGLFDIDEYINIQGISNIEHFFNQLIKNENIDVNKIGSFRLLNKYFYNPKNLPVANNQFLNIYNCDNITTRGREKNFVLPKNVITFSVHMITSGKPMYNVNEKLARFNHYIYLNKKSRGRNITNLIDDTISFHLKNE